MQLSIIIPVLNDAVALARLLAILQPMRSRGAQVIVVDGDSTDSPDHVTADLADDFLVATRGRATQQHAGALRASGDAFWFVHADCVPAHNADTLIEQALARGQWGRFDVKLLGRSRWLAVIAWTMNQRSRLTGICTGDQGIFVSRLAYEAVQGMPQIQLMEDVEFSKRLKQLSRPVRVVQPLQVSARRWDTRGVWRTIFTMWWLRLLYFFGTDPTELYRLYYGTPSNSRNPKER
jgi:rSAM/selenodomain-associated transferase 2